ncbi:glucose-6-phosphate dehydrogenase assembly protein OpcA [Sediminihabitans luteus]|uniref:Glucose-6-phosphate dehydrogenase assembly protein OpcA n=1 Tax=Sediminihabitans luteus TaxID=1138585 RepID=A0A2M9CQT4_9CELL|nr:glucose-6-phosphate dehydrogenase assembly protein OpcA [Sediminihabitans luteus]PJJ74300.1 glucose-6-phosphate dehydrogenase assembly protein OpcA [Sediminihabitans luteus]GII99153.1 glucose-6-phosphate dehydrogenase assembly protein OpcA [Sediminihabitans luteus]
MIIDMPDTTTNAVNKRLVNLRDEGGAIALGRVLTLVILTDEDSLEDAVEAANSASREHPCRIVVVAPTATRGSAGLDAQIRVGGDAGASEVVVLRPSGTLREHTDTLVMPLLLPDAPIVAWWPGQAPENPAGDLVGRMAHRRITDAVACTGTREVLDRLGEHHEPGDTDLAWTRITVWRGLIAAALDQPPYEPVTSVLVEGAADHPSVDLLAAWLGRQLRCPATVARVDGVEGITRVELVRRGGSIELSRPDGRTATLTEPGKPVRHLAMPLRTLQECLSEELRRLDPDEVFGEVLTKGLAGVSG